MITVRQIDRLWTAKAYGKLFRELTAARPEASLRAEMELGRAVPAAAMAMIRLDELSQSYVPMYGRLLRFVLNEQQADGGWGDVMSTALCVRALLCGQGSGAAIDRGLKYLAEMQKPEGVWPLVAIRRLPGDAFSSAFIMLQLGDASQFRQAVRFDEAVEWFEKNEAEVEGDARKLWDRASQRCKRVEAARSTESHLWS